MINSITLESYKSFLYRDLGFNNLTILTGLNSCGKSTIIQSLLIFERAFNNESSLLLDGHGTEAELKNKNTKEDIKFSIEINETDFNINFPKNKTTLEKNIFPDLWYISANRFGGQLSIPTNSQLKNKVGKNGENVLKCIEYYDIIEPVNLDEKMKHQDASSYTLLENVRAWLKVISPNVQFDYKITDVSDSSYATYNNYRATNVGFGLSYILPVITALLASTLSENNLVIIENPEAHLHPKGQSELAKLICLCAESGTQVIVETHSDHVFNGVRLFIKENSEFSNKSLFHWFELDENNNTEVTSIIADENGRINEWPKGFFDQFENNLSKLL